MATVLAPPKHDVEPAVSGDEVWREVYEGSFAVLSFVTPEGKPRSSGVMYTTIARHLYIAVAADGWKARHIGANSNVSVTIPVRRGGPLALVTPIPPATITFQGTAIVHPATSPEIHDRMSALSKLLPPERREHAAVIEIIPEGCFVTYGVGVPLMKMRHPDMARARIPVWNRGW